MKLFRSINRYFRDACKGVFRNFSLSLASISCITITLIVVALSVVLSSNVERMIEHVSDNMSIVVILDLEFKYDKDSKNVEKLLSNIENVDGIKFKSKNETAFEMKEKGQITEALYERYMKDGNPIFDSYIVTVDDVNMIDQTANEIKNINLVDRIRYGEEYIQKTITMFNLIEKSCIVGVVALILVTAFLISNTIKLAIFSRKTEIEIMRLVGASNISIKIPFILEGGFIGLIGTIIPIVLVCYGYGYFYNVLDGNLLFEAFGKLIHPYPFIIYVSGLLLLIGLLVGMFGSSSAVKKYLKI